MDIQTLLVVLVPVAGLAIGLGIAWLLPRRATPERDDLLVDARNQRDERIRAARSQALEVRAEAEAAARQSLAALEEVEHRLSRREERLEGRLDNATAREAAADQREAALAERVARVTAAYAEQVAVVEEIRALSPEAARAKMLEQAAPSIRAAAIARVESIIAEGEQAASRIMNRPTALAVQRSSSELVSEFAMVPVPIPREEIKGRIIGREGRNIKAFEALTGVELVIDDAPDVVTLSGFDPFRREVARLALLDLIEDGRIHPGRIEEAVKRTREALTRQLREDGARASEAAGAGSVPTEIAELLGRLRLLRGGGEDALTISVRNSALAATMAQELKADARIARRAALLRNIGLAVGREAGGSTYEITADVLARAGEPPILLAAVRPAAEMYPEVTAEQAAVWLARDVGDAAPATRDEPPVRRVDTIERVATLVDGVADALAFQVGTRVRLLIRPTEPIDPHTRLLLGRTIIDRIESSLGPRVGLTIAFIVGSARRRGGEGADANGAGRFEGGRHGRGRSGRRGS